jgi:hypothetical protein
MNSTLRNRALNLALKVGLGGLALVLWHAPAAKAQECCPDSYTAAEMAKMENLGKKPVNTLVAGEKQNKTVLVARFDANGAQAMKAARKENSARVVAVKQPVKTLDVKE